MTVLSSAASARLPALRGRILRMIHDAQAGHPGGSLSVIDLLAVIMLDKGRFTGDPDLRDWLVLAKGHAVPALYAMLVELGDLEESELASYRHLGSRLQGHPDRRKTPGVQVSTGHLGQGLSVALGIAMGERRRDSGRHVWAVAGEGDLHEGQSWEALMAAPHHGIGDLTVVVDANGLTQHGPVGRIMGLEPLVGKLESFGWATVEVDGHDPVAFGAALDEVRADPRPGAVVARTVKGHGVSFMENVREWHSRGLDEDELRRALDEIGEG